VGNIIRRFLADKGYSVTVAKNGLDGLELLRREPFDVLILDIYMPKLNGLETLRRMRREGIEPKVVLSTSGQADDESARQTLRLGAHDFLVKPIDLNYLDWAIQLRL
jgi:DNA-binding response OmpR family regulator